MDIICASCFNKLLDLHLQLLTIKTLYFFLLHILQFVPICYFSKTFFYSSGDGRNDSPGHCAQYLTYTVIEHDTKDIVAMAFVDKREVDLKSPNMEKVGLCRVLDHLAGKGLEVGELVTDAHVQIKSMMGMY